MRKEEPSSYGRSVPTKKIDVFDDFRAYKLRAVRALNNLVFRVEKPFIPLVICTNLDVLSSTARVHNKQYPFTKDMYILHRLIETNGGFNFSLFSFDVSDFILSPGFYVKDGVHNQSVPALASFVYNADIYNPAFNGRNPIPGATPYQSQPSFTVEETTFDCSAILIYLEV